MIYVPDALDAFVPLAVAWTALLALSASRLVEGASPSRAAQLLSAAAVGATLSAGTAVVAVVGVLLARVPVIATWGCWASGALPEPGVSWLWVIPLAVAVTALLLAGLRHFAAVVHQLWAAQNVCRSFSDATPSPAPAAVEPATATDDVADAEWVVIDAALPEAYAVPGKLGPQRGWPWRPRPDEAPEVTQRRGQIVVSRAMLAVLTPAQQRVLLEHERAHLRHRHYLWVQLSEAAAVLNPALSRVPALVRSAAERQADLDAAGRVGDATLTARAIAAAALARSDALRRSTAVAQPLQATGGDVVHRVDYLLQPTTTRSGRLGSAVLCAVIALSALTSVGTLYSLTARLHHAQEHHAQEHHARVEGPSVPGSHEATSASTERSTPMRVEVTTAGPAGSRGLSQ